MQNFLKNCCFNFEELMVLHTFLLNGNQWLNSLECNVNEFWINIIRSHVVVKMGATQVEGFFEDKFELYIRLLVIRHVGWL